MRSRGLAVELGYPVDTGRLYLPDLYTWYLSGRSIYTAILSLLHTADGEGCLYAHEIEVAREILQVESLLWGSKNSYAFLR